jgi:hypothetical protein
MSCDRDPWLCSTHAFFLRVLRTVNGLSGHVLGGFRISTEELQLFRNIFGMPAKQVMQTCMHVCI